MSQNPVHGTWSSRWTFVLAATGAAVGLGNIWKFPYITGENGGGAFVLIYLVCIALVGLPIMIAETMLGRRGRKNPIDAVSDIAVESQRSTRWAFIGRMGLIAGLLIMSFYSVVAGWSMHYVVTTALGNYNGANPEQVGSAFNQLLASPSTLVGWHTAFTLMTFGVVAAGVSKGLGSVAKYMMPFLFCALIILLIYGFFAGDLKAAALFLFRFDFSALTINGIVIAMGHAFFTLSIGMGTIMAYGAYMPHKTCIGKTTLAVGALDTGIAVIAGLGIFSIVFANTAIEPGAGPGLLFVSLPVAFGNMPMGIIFGTLFFILVTVAAWSSSVSLIEPAVAWLIENKNKSRVYASAIVTVLTWLVGILTVLSFNHLADFKPAILLHFTPFDFLDFLTSQIMLPLGGLLIALFVAWKVPIHIIEDETDLLNRNVRLAWLYTLKFISPALVVIVMVLKLYETLIPQLFS